MKNADARLLQTVAPLLAAGRAAAAAEPCQAELRRRPDSAWAHALLGLARHLSGRPDLAIDDLAHAVRLDPDNVEFLTNLGQVLLSAGHLDRALAPLERAAALDPASVAALNNLANARYHLRDFPGAAAAYAAASALAPADPAVHLNLGRALAAQRLHAQAEAVFRLALPLPGAPALGVHHELAGTLRALGRFPEALDAARLAAAEAPDAVPRLTNLAAVCLELRRLDEAAAASARAVALTHSPPAPPTPAAAQALWSHGVALFYAGLPTDSIDHLLRAAALAPADPDILNTTLFISRHDPALSPTAALDLHRRWADLAVRPHLAPHALPPGYDTTPDRPLRVGFLSPDLRDHPVARFLLPLLLARPRAALHVTCYADHPRADPFTARLRAASDDWRDTASLTHEQLDAQIRADRIDVLVDLACHCDRNRQTLFAARPAPCQITYLAYPSTTGSPALSHKLTDPLIDPPGPAEPLNTETLLRLPAYFTYAPPPDAPDDAIDAFPSHTRSPRVTLASTHGVTKLNPAVLRAWAEILRRTPNADLDITLPVLESPSVSDRILATFRAADVDPARIRFRPAMPFDAYRRAHLDFDLLLDPFPYPGGTTTCHALHMHTPVVTLRGAPGVSRMGASLLEHVGLPHLAADTVDAYIDTAARLAQSPDERHALRSTLRTRLLDSPLCDPAANAASLFGLLRQAWLESLAR